MTSLVLGKEKLVDRSCKIKKKNIILQNLFFPVDVKTLQCRPVRGSERLKTIRRKLLASSSVVYLRAALRPLFPKKEAE